MSRVKYIGYDIHRVSKEAAEQYVVANNEVGKLADMSGLDWDLIATKTYRKEMAGSALFGATSVAAVIGLVKLVKKIRKNRKLKREPESK